MQKLILLTASYIIGSIPFGFLIAYWVKRFDIRKFGSGNIGATNVFRVVGRPWCILVFILDFFKGFIPPLSVKALIPDSPSYIFIFAAFLAVCGHNWTCFLKFKGGKGVATSVGAVCALSLIFPRLWLILGLTILLWIIIFLLFRYVSLASIFAAFSFFALCLFLSHSAEINIVAFVFFVFILLRHKKNIKKLFDRTEHRF